MAEQISDFTALTTLESGDLIPVVDVSDTTDAATGTTKKITAVNFLGYSSYIPVVTQSGTATLGQTVIFNNTGITSAWTRSSLGVYYLDFTGITGTFYSENYSNWTGNAVTKVVVKGDGTETINGSYTYWWDSGNSRVYLYCFNNLGDTAIDLSGLIGVSALSLPEIRFYV